MTKTESYPARQLKRRRNAWMRRNTKMVVLLVVGTLVLGDETRALQYGQDELRDVAGYVERIGPARWRLMMPKPHFESQMDVMELVPVAVRSSASSPKR